MAAGMSARMSMVRDTVRNDYLGSCPSMLLCRVVLIMLL